MQQRIATGKEKGSLYSTKSHVVLQDAFNNKIYSKK